MVIVAVMERSLPPNASDSKRAVSITGRRGCGLREPVSEAREGNPAGIPLAKPAFIRLFTGA